MNQAVTDLFSFRSGTLKDVNKGWLIATEDALQTEGIVASDVFTWNRGGESGQVMVDWLAIGVVYATTPIEEVLIVGEYGDILSARGGARHQERLVENEDEAPGPLRRVRVIEGRAYIAGMGREVYRRDSASRWQMIGPGDEDEPEDAVCGFEGIDGFSTKDIYASGWRGEIWRYNDRRWIQVEGPTNLAVSNLVCGGDGFVYLCGAKGLLVRGREDSWETLAQDDTIEDFWGLCWFQGNLYLSTLHCVYRLVGNSLQRVRLGTDTPVTCYELTAVDGLMWSIGAKDVRAFDGKRWSKVII